MIVDYYTGGKVYLACRSVERARLAVEEIRKATGVSENQLVVLQLDLGSLDSIRNFAKEFKHSKLGHCCNWLGSGNGLIDWLVPTSSTTWMWCDKNWMLFTTVWDIWGVLVWIREEESWGIVEIGWGLVMVRLTDWCQLRPTTWMWCDKNRMLFTTVWDI